MSKEQFCDTVTLEFLDQYARITAGNLAFGDLISAARYAKSAQKNLTIIKAVLQKASAYAEIHVTIPQEVEWLLDNWYIAEREGKSAIADIRHSPRMTSIQAKKRLVISEAASALVRSGSGCVTSERIEVFLDAFQDVICFSEAELAAFIPVIRLELIAVLTEACLKVRNVVTDGTIEDGLADLLGRCFTSLRFLSGFDASEIMENVNRVERTLRCDPTGVYSAMDEQTRFHYRHEIARLSHECSIKAHEIATKTLELARKSGTHIGTFIFKQPLGCERKERTGACYIGLIVVASLFFSLLISFALDEPAIALLLLFPVSDFTKNITDFFVLKFVHPQRVPRLALTDGVPEAGKTLCVISVRLSGTEAGIRAAGLLEEYRLANRDAGKNLMFGILADLPDALSETLPDDETVIQYAASEIDKLNRKYGGGFFLFYRGRRFNELDSNFTAWERKRGAILELCRFLNNRSDSLRCVTGDSGTLTGTKYVITLDSDTRLCAGTAKELIGAALHPLNKPVIDLDKGIVTNGSAIIQPRISVDLASANQTDYTRIFAGQGGIDPYGGMTGDIYQNLFGTGSFAGKGIIDVEAYLACLDTRFPENTVLSHDLLEGAYLRCSFAGDIELTDGYPAKVTTYYDRMHRWTRGDWQSVYWLFRKVRTSKNVSVKNHLGQIDRWKIADNLRRSLVPLFSFVSLAAGMLFDNSDFIWASVVAVLSTISCLVITTASGIFKKYHSRVRYQSSIISGFGGQLLQTLIRLVFLPYEAWVTLSAISTALYRMLVSHRHLLNWVTAADSEKLSKNTLLYVIWRMWPAILASALIAAFTPFRPAIVVAVIWILSPLLVFHLGRDNRKKETLAPDEKLSLTRMAGDIWRYFDELLTAEDHWLPPDNFQEQPAVGIAHRTSPTNIGLALLSALAAYDLGVCSKERALEVISKVLGTIAVMPKWNGHLYNWYDTMTLSVLQPSYVSTVDSGNFAGCLITLREGLLELGQNDLADITDKLLCAMSFTPLFDEKRQLFYIGWDMSRNAPTEGWYDLLASEARQTSYLAIARGDIPRKHWRRLGRSLVVKDGFRGMASWTGTMFEYLMPELLLPCYYNSLIYESLKFCIYVQKKRVKGVPWGMSESAFYAFDHTLSYRYKAHGVQRLALKRGMDRDTVISPYSTFLSLPIDPKAAVRNLQKLQKLGAEGRYGLYEAVDYTPSRLRNKKFEIVKTYMVHHIGMSLLAIDNTLKSGIMQQRFMRDREMASFAELLQEKVPIGGVILRQPPRDVPEKPLRLVSQGWSYQSSNINYRNPRCTLLGNGAYNVIIAETGQSSSVWNGILMTKTSADQLGPDAGMSFFLNCDNDLVSLLPSPMFDQNIHYSAELAGSCSVIKAKSASLRTSMTVSVPENDAGERRVIEVISSVQRDAELICYFEPVLSRLSDYESHPAFSKLSLETSLYDGSVVVRRRPRAKGRGIALAFDSDTPFTFDTSREKALGRGGIFALKTGLTKAASSTLGAVLDPCVLLRVKLHLKPDVPCCVSFALTTASTPQAASAAAKRILSINEQPTYSRLDETAHRLKLTAEQTDKTMSLLPDLIYASPDRMIDTEYVPYLRQGQKSLWSLGISGDLPIVSVVIEDTDDVEKDRELIKLHRLLSENGISFDLVYLLRGGGDYRSTLRDAMLDFLKLNDLEGRVGARGGIHLADLSTEGANTVRAVSVRHFSKQDTLVLPNTSQDLVPHSRTFLCNCLNEELSTQYNDDNSFTFTVKGKMPHNAWSHMLANESFGYLATDAGTGHMWYLNARENKINIWLNDSLAAAGTERLEIIQNGERLSLFASQDGYPCKVTYGFGWAKWQKSIAGCDVTTTAFVPPDTAARVLIIEAADGQEFQISYFTDLLLAPEADQGIYISTSHSSDSISAENLYNTDFPGTTFFLTASVPESSFTCSKTDWLSGQLSGITGTGVTPCAAAVYRAARALVIVTGCDDLKALRSLCSLESALKKLQETTEYWHTITNKFTVETPSVRLNSYINGWATYQTLACRIFGRSSLYQSGGAYGFRDQLQDVCAVIDEVPDVVRAQIIRAAKHQFSEGDVQHWWHPRKNDNLHGDKGVRTRCSDDLLWLPYALCEYSEKTGDVDIFNVQVPFISSQPLAEDESERYEEPQKSQHQDTLLNHAIKAVDLVLMRGTGRHGLALIGSGDWNDGMNLVGAGGEGESVWLTWFICVTASRLAEICMKMDNPGAASRFTDAVDRFRKAAESAWDGDWYKRGYYDDGTPLGSCVSDECRIDSIAQSFAALADADPDKTKKALNSSVNRLFDREGRVVRLFDPPFSNGSSTPGYIKGYSPGFRENGGQYTHGAVWLAMGLFLEGLTDEGWNTLEALLPQGRPDEIYRTEPYVLAADVYTAPGHVGRGGWTWYTGAAGWFKRVALENLLGVRLEDGRLHIKPSLPSSWDGYSAVWKNDGTEYHIVVKRDGHVTVTANGEPYNGGSIIIDMPDFLTAAESS